MENEKNEEKKAHIYEIDFLRALTVFSVVAIHTLSATSQVYSATTAQTDFMALCVHILHYNREIFVFVTGLVLTYVYFNRRFSPIRFWSKRLLLIFIPYVLWSLIYTKFNNGALDANKFLSLSWTNIYTGNASYQLYYILLTLQYYAVFPLFLWFIKKVYKHPIAVVGISFIVQLIFIYLDFTYLQRGSLSNLPIVKDFINQYRDRLFITYQFFFFFGSIVAIYINDIYRWIKQNGKYFPPIFLIVFCFYSFYFYYQLAEKESLDYALSVIQPSVVIYSTIAISFFSWIAVLWAKKKKMFAVIKTISDTSFGIFFVHVMILTYIAQNILPMLSSTIIPPFLKIIGVDLVTFGLSLLLCLLLIRIPMLGWTIGRTGKKK
jgi:surface polysaccharide O-acyltransferase-like enzyme